jgi:DNA-binding response OmpR family regulator
MELRTLFIEDNEILSKNLKRYFDGENFSNHILRAESVIKFEEGISLIEKIDYDLIVLDLYKDGADADETAGIKVLEIIQKIAFVPVIFYTGHAHKVQHLTSEVVGVVNKGDGFDNLRAEIQRIINSKIALLKGQVYNHLRESLRHYFWDTVHNEKKYFEPVKKDVSIGYLLLRRFANSLSKENIKEILGDDKIKRDKTHPMEFYIFPSGLGEYEAGEILFKDGLYYSILTPNCDFVEEGGRSRRVGKVLLCVATDLKETEEYKKYQHSKSNNNLKELNRLIQSRKSDRYFFLPGTPFLPNLILDFQNKNMFEYSDLKSFSRVAKLDDPYAQSMISSFIRYYNRIGFPDIDTDYIIQNL